MNGLLTAGMKEQTRSLQLQLGNGINSDTPYENGYLGYLFRKTRKEMSMLAD